MQSQRQFEIIYLLLRRGQATAKELAAHLEVSVRTIYRDIDALSLAGVPVYTSKGRQGGIRLLEGFVLDKALLTSEEQRELLSAMQAVQATRAPSDPQMLKKLASFLAEAPPQWLEIEFAAWGPERGLLLEKIKTAIVHRRELRFHYWGREGGHAWRTVHPLMLSFQERAWYLKAFCLLRQDFRMFRVSRMMDVDCTEETFEETYRAEAFSSPIQLQPMPLVHLVLWIDAQVTYRVLDEFSAEQVATNEDGSLTVHVTYPEDEWVYGFLMSFGHHIKVISPKRVRDMLAERFRQALENLEPPSDIQHIPS